MMRKLAIVIVNWNGYQDTLVCLGSLKKALVNNVETEIIVVDNGSTNDSVAQIKKKFPRITLIETKENLGFSGGNNTGIRYALNKNFDIIWLLNNDTVVSGDVVKQTVSSFDRHKDAGIIGAKIYFYPGREFHYGRYRKNQRGKVIWYAGGLIDWANMYASHRGVDEVDRGQYDEGGETQFVSGCSMAARKEVFRKIGFLDDRLFLYLEDLDFCLRAKKAGFKLWYEPSIIVWHVNAGSSDKPGNPLHEYYLNRNRIIVAGKYASIRTNLAILRESAGQLLTASKVRRKAITDAYTGRMGNRFTWSKKTI